MAPQPGLKPGTLYADTTFMAGYVESYIEFLRNRLSPRVFELYASALRRMPRLSLEAWDSYFSTRKASGKTLNNELGIYKGFLQWLNSRGITSWDKGLLSYPRFRHVPTKFRRALTKDEIYRLKRVSGKRWRWWSFLLHTGLRKSEFEGLSWNDINLSVNPFIRVMDAKNKNKERIVPLHDELVNILKKLPMKNNPFTLPKRRCSLLRNFKKDLAKAGISLDIDLHCLRVTFVTALANAGVGPRTAQELAGHSDIRTTLKIYTKVTDQDKVDAVNRLKF